MQTPITRWPRSLAQRTSRKPWWEFSPLSDDFSSFFDDTERALTESSRQLSGYDFSPACDISERKKEFVFKFDLPGVKKKDVKIEIDDNNLIVSGSRQEEKKDEDEKSRRQESFYGSYMRSFALPSNVDADKIDASYADGVLIVTVPKNGKQTQREVKIH